VALALRAAIILIAESSGQFTERGGELKRIRESTRPGPICKKKRI